LAEIEAIIKKDKVVVCRCLEEVGLKVATGKSLLGRR
jgi:hypothetical protein